MKYHNITQSIVTVKTTQVEIRLFTNELNHALYEEDYNLACIVRDKIKEKEYSIEKVKSMLEKHLSELEFFDNDYIFERRFLTNSLLTWSFLVISKDPLLETIFPGINLSELGLGVISV